FQRPAAPRGLPSFPTRRSSDLKRSCGRCYGASTFDPQRFSFRDFETDAIDGLKYLKTRSEVDPNALVVLGASQGGGLAPFIANQDRKSTRLNSSHVKISYAVFC